MVLSTTMNTELLYFNEGGGTTILVDLSRQTPGECRYSVKHMPEIGI